MNKTSIARWLTTIAFLLLTAVLSIASACGDLLEQVAEDATTGTSNEVDPCAAFDAETCEAHSECFGWWGSRVDLETPCGTTTFIGCEAIDPERGCNNAVTTAWDESGSCWIFGDSCMPLGFTDATPRDPVCGAAVISIPECGAE